MSVPTGLSTSRVDSVIATVSILAGVAAGGPGAGNTRGLFGVHEGERSRRRRLRWPNWSLILAGGLAIIAWLGGLEAVLCQVLPVTVFTSGLAQTEDAASGGSDASCTPDSMEDWDALGSLRMARC
jgi:hypothetical protein